MTRFEKDNAKGLEFQNKCFPYLSNMAEDINCGLITAEQYLPKKVYRVDDLRFPDFMMFGEYDPANRMFFESKRKDGWPLDGKIYVTVEKKYIDDYLELSKKYNAPLAILMYCDKTKKAYWITDFSDLTEHMFDNRYSQKKGDVSYIFFVDALQEIPELHECC